MQNFQSNTIFAFLLLYFVPILSWIMHNKPQHVIAISVIQILPQQANNINYLYIMYLV